MVELLLCWLFNYLSIIEIESSVVVGLVLLRFVMFGVELWIGLNMVWCFFRLLLVAMFMFFWSMEFRFVMMLLGRLGVMYML